VKTVVAADGELVYVDLIENDVLELILAALDGALARYPDLVWPGIKSKGEVVSLTADRRPVLVPLERLGSVQGYSGASVFVCYFLDSSVDDLKLLPSRPLVIKIGAHTSLQRELRVKNFWPSHPSGHDGRFALPFFLSKRDPVTKRGVLISHFSGENIFAIDGWQLQLADLWSLLRKDPVPEEQLMKSNSELFELVHGIHREGRVNCQRRSINLYKEYAYYLRHQNRKAGVAHDTFGSEAEVVAFGKSWSNPSRILEAIRRMAPVEVACGPVHGDLHPKNVVFGQHDVVNVIDFGWATKSGHIVRDYVLMELNYRAMTFPSGVSFESLEAMSRNLDPDEDNVAIPDARLESRMKLIRDGVWEQVRNNGVVSSWDVEYLVPMFLVAYGLLKHLDNARNQSALLMTLLSLGDRISAKLLVTA
jgi:hypothetical protein